MKSISQLEPRGAKMSQPDRRFAGHWDFPKRRHGSAIDYCPSAGAGQRFKYPFPPASFRQNEVVLGLIDQPIRFSTKWVDGEEAMPLLYAPNANLRTLANYGHRHFAPQLGHWINRDPIGEQGGLNLCGMEGNDPVGRVDVLGHDEFYEDLIAKGVMRRRKRYE